MVEVIQTDVFSRWLIRLKDGRARARIQVRIDRLAGGNPGDVRPVGDGVSELRIDYGPGYRVYILQRGAILVVLLCGGEKASQVEDIASATDMARQWKGLM